MKKISVLIILLSAFFNGIIAQELKTFHKLCPSCEENPNVTMTGYEDEFGNIVRHGKLTYVYGDTTISINDIGKGDAAQRIKEYKNVTMNFSNGKLDGLVNAYFTQKNSGLNGEWEASLLYNNGSFVSIDATGSDRDTRAVAKITQKGNIVVGPFEVLTLERSPYNKFDTIDYYVGEFDTNGLATGKWRIKGSGARFVSNGERLGNELFFYQGYCIGNSMEGKELAIKYFIEKSINIEDLYSQGFYIISDISIPAGYYSEPKPANSIMQNVFKFIKTRWEHTLFGFASSSKITMRLEDNVVVKPFKDGIMKVNYSFNVMSEDMYKTIYDNLSQKCQVYYGENHDLVYLTKSVTIRYDSLLHNYYILKADKVTRMYVPGNHKSDFASLIDYTNVKYFLSLGAGCGFDTNVGKYKVEDKGIANRPLYIEDSLFTIINDFIVDDIQTCFNKAFENKPHKYIFDKPTLVGISKEGKSMWKINAKEGNPVDEMDNLIMNIGCECEFEVKPLLLSDKLIEKWDANCSLSMEKSKKYKTPKENKRLDFIRNRISKGGYTYSQDDKGYIVNNGDVFMRLTPEEKQYIDNEAFKVCRNVLTEYLTALKKAKPDKVSENIRDFLPVKDFEILDFSSELDKGYVIGTFKFTKQVGKKSETETYKTDIKIVFDPFKGFVVSESSLVFGKCNKL